MRAHAAVLDSPDAVPLLLLTSELLNIVCLLGARFSRAVDRSPWAAGLTLIGAFYFLVVELSPDGTPLAPALGEVVQLSGLGLQIAAKLFLGRSFGLLPANRGVVTRGPYRLVRHPMYLGYFLGHLGFLLGRFSWWNLGVYTALYTVQLLRIREEERFLAADPEFRAYAERVRYRFIPGVW